MISVVIPLYNKEISILNTLQCVIEQTFKNFEIVIIDDGSTDSSVEIVKNIVDDRIKLFQKTNGGVSSARNYGINKSKYDYIAFLDADDYWKPNHLEELVRMIQDFPVVGMWGCEIEEMTAFEKKETLKQEQFRGIIKNYWRSHPPRAYWSSSSVIIRKTIFEVVGYFDERIKYGEDIDMWYRIMLHYPVAYTTEVLAFYRQDAENRAMNSEISLQQFLPYYIEKYAEFRKNNKDFRIFFDHEILGRLYPYFLKDRKNKDIHRIVKQISLSEQKLSYRIKFRFPSLYERFIKVRTKSVWQQRNDLWRVKNIDN